MLPQDLRNMFFRRPVSNLKDNYNNRYDQEYYHCCGEYDHSDLLLCQGLDLWKISRQLGRGCRTDLGLTQI